MVAVRRGLAPPRLGRVRALAASALAICAIGSADARAEAEGSAEPTAEPARGEVEIYIEGASPLELRRRGGRFGEHLCYAPCGARLTLLEGAPLVLRADHETYGFTLETGRRYVLRIDGDPAWSSAGFVGTLAGFGAAGGAAMVFAFHAIGSGVGGQPITPEAQTAYVVTMISGGVIGAVGLTLHLVFKPELVIVDRGALRVAETPLRLGPRGLSFEF